MPRDPIEVSPYELAVLEVLWDRGPSTIREISQSIYGKSTTACYATVQKLLERLEVKRCVKRRRQSPAHTFQAKIDRSDLIATGLEVLARKLCGGSFTPLLMHLTARVRLTKPERDLLQKLIEGNGN